MIYRVFNVSLILVILCWYCFFIKIIFKIVWEVFEFGIIDGYDRRGIDRSKGVKS